jgi:hypothetical protein
LASIYDRKGKMNHHENTKVLRGASKLSAFSFFSLISFAFRLELSALSLELSALSLEP